MNGPVTVVLALLLVMGGEAWGDATKGVPPTSHHAPQDNGSEAALRQHHEDKLRGILVDRTITLAAKTFFSRFAQMRLYAPGLLDASLTIHERPSARWGSLIWITEGDDILYRTSLSPRLSTIDDDVKQAITAVQEQVVRKRLMDALQPNQDLAGDGL
ncbi:CsgE family curli-type amyloid fiber assembly protein [Halomonas sp. WWR20]